MRSAARRATSRSSPQWQTGPHRVTTRRSSSTRNTTPSGILMDDCLRCHGMHFEGGARPGHAGGHEGPVEAGAGGPAAAPAIPCLTCHAVHRAGRAAESGHVAQGGRSPQGGDRPAVAGVLRPADDGAGAASRMLPVPRSWTGERPVRMSPDPRQALCYQCHAPLAGVAGGLRRRPHADGRSRGAFVPGLPRQAPADDARVVRDLPSAAVQLRPRRREDGHHVLQPTSRSTTFTG